jgi:alanine dehydrogenase
MPAAAARTASLALERAVLPFVQKLAAGEMSSDLITGVQAKNGKVTHEHLARDTGRAYSRL